MTQVTAPAVPLEGIAILEEIPRPSTSQPVMDLSGLNEDDRLTVQAFVIRLVQLRIAERSLVPTLAPGYEACLRARGAWQELCAVFVRLYPFAGDHPSVLDKAAGDIAALTTFIDTQLLVAQPIGPPRPARRTDDWAFVAEALTAA